MKKDIKYKMHVQGKKLLTGFFVFLWTVTGMQFMSGEAAAQVKLPSIPSNTQLSNSYEYNSEYVYRVKFGDSYLEDGAIIAYVDGKIRGAQTASVLFTPTNTMVYKVRLFSNSTSGETITFKYYDVNHNKIYDVTETQAFQADNVPDYSSPQTLNAYCGATGQVSDMVPADNATGVDAGLTFYWQPADNATHYSLFLWKDGDAKPSTAFRNDIYGTSSYVSGLEYGKKYHWFIRSFNQCGDDDGTEQVFTVRELPDLIVTSVSVPDTVESSDEFDVDVTVKNNGLGTTRSGHSWYNVVYASADNTLSSDDKEIGRIANNRVVQADSSFDQAITVKTPVDFNGDYYILVKTDAFNSEPESDNDNNTGGGEQVYVKQKPLPDVLVKDITFTATNAAPGDTITVNWKVANIGSADATGGWTERLYLVSLSGKKVGLTGTQYFNGLLKKDSVQERQSDVVIPKILGFSGDAYIEVQLYPASGLVEFPGNDANNKATSAGRMNISEKLYLSLPTTEVKEDYPGSLRCYVSRSGATTNELTANLTASQTGSLNLPASVTIPSRSSSSAFDITVNDNSSLDGTRDITISASGGSLSDAAELKVLDDEVPSLTLTYAADTLKEGDTITVQIARDMVITDSTVVYLSSDRSEQFTLPAYVVIPAGATTTDATVIVTQDNIGELDYDTKLLASSSGLVSAEKSFFIKDDDIPAIEMELENDTVAEGDGVYASAAIIKRTEPGTCSVNITISANVSGALYFPTSITLGKDEMSKKINIGVIDNATVDGIRNVTITGAVYLSSCSCGAPATSGGVVSKTLTILDNDGPTLKLSISPASLKEGLDDAGTLTVYRNTATTNDLQVNLSTNDTSEVELPATVTIPAGESTLQVPVKTKDDGMEDGNQMVGITGESNGFNSGIVWVYVTDINKPDVEMTDLEVSTTTPKAEDFLRVESQIVNSGYGSAPSGMTISFYLSKDDIISDDDTMFYQVMTKEPVQIDSAINFVEVIKLPAMTGDYYLLSKANPDFSVTELVYKNNDSKSSLLSINPTYTATAETATEQLQKAEPVTITGTATMPDGSAAANVDVDVYVICDGARRVIKATTDDHGDYSALFEPYSYETGHFSIGACYPGQELNTEMDAFDIMGMERASKDYFIWNIKKDVPKSGTIAIKNRSNIPLHNVTAYSDQLPDSCEITMDTIPVLAGGAVDTIHYTVVGRKTTNGVNYVQFPLTAVSQEDVKFDFTTYYYCQALQANLEADPVSINTTFTKGKTRYLEVEVHNIGAGGTGEVNIELPDVDYMSLVSPAKLDDIASGDTIVVTLMLYAGDDVPLNIPLKGNFVLHVSNGRDLSIPYYMEAVSEDKGNLIVDVIDEYTYFTDEAPHVEGAHVVLTHPYTGEIIGEGFTDTTGVFRIDSIPEGEYTLKVEKEHHDGYQNNVTVDPGRDTRKSVFLDFQAITYTWDVVPVDLEDHYQVDLIMKYETNVPVPVVVMEMPKEMPELLGDEKYTFMVTITNKGLITADNIELKFPEDDPEYEWIFSFPGTQLLAQQAIQVPVVMQRRTSAPSGEKAPDVAIGGTSSPLKGAASINSTGPCNDVALTLYDYKCGDDRKLHQAGALFTISGRVCLGGGGGAIGSGSGLGGGCEGVCDGGESGAGSSSYTKSEGVGCDPCFNAMVGALMGCTGVHDALGCLWGFTDGVQLDDFVGCIPKGKLGCPYGVGMALLCIYQNAGGPPGGPSDNSGGTAANTSGDKGSKLKGGIAGAAVLPVQNSAFISFIWQLITENNHVIDFHNARISYADEIMGNIDWQNKEGFNDLMLISNDEIKGFRHFTTTDVQAVKVAVAGSDITPAEVDYFTTRWNNSVDAWAQNILEPDALHPDIVNKNLIDSLLSARNDILDYAQSRGYNSVGEMFEHVLSYFMELQKKSQSSVCASVTIKLSQELVMTREAFEGTLTIENGNATKPMENIKLDLVIKNEKGEVCNDLFEIETKALDILTGIDGTGVLGSKQKGSATVLFIPEKGAAPEVPENYSFGGTFSYKDPFTGATVTKPLSPVTLQVNPSPDLYLHYFMQRDILGDDALTKDVIEPIVPAELGLMIVNNGYGTAKNVRVESAQPVIVDNEKGLSIHFALVGSNLNGQERQLGLTNINFGSIPAKSASIGQWWFTSDLLGHFVDYETNVTHLDSRGNPDLSLISGAKLHELIKSVKVYGAGDDGISDFLVNDVFDAKDIPDAIYMSQGDAVLNVYKAEAASFTGSLSSSTLKIVNNKVGWNYIKIPDPGNGNYEIVRVTRNWDGVEIPLDNAWLTFVTLPDGGDPVYENMFHIVDNLEETGEHEYTVVWRFLNNRPLKIDSIYHAPTAVTSQPVTSLNVHFNKPIDASTFTYEDMMLRLQGGDDIMDNSVSIIQTDSVTYNIDLSSLTTGNGLYAFTVQSAEITALDGNKGQTGKQVLWTQFLNVPAVDEFIGIPDSIITTAFDYCLVKFNMPVDANTVVPERFRLLRNGAEVASSLSVAKMDVESQTFKISGMASLMSVDGEYTLVVDLKNIANLDGEKGLIEQPVSWKMDTTPPVVLSFTPDADNGFDSHHYTGIQIRFSEPVYGIDVNSVELWKDGVQQPLSQVHFDNVTDSIWYLTQFRLLTYYEGDYTLKVLMNEVNDEAGIYGTGTAEFNWTVDRTAPLAVQDLHITPDLGNSDADNVTSATSLNVNMTVMSDNMDIEVYRNDFDNLTLLADTSGINSGNLSVPVEITSPGNILLDVHTVNSIGNYSSSQLSIVVDRTSPAGALRIDSTVFLRAHPDSVIFSVSDKLAESSIDLGLLKLTKDDDGSEVVLTGVAVHQLSDTTYAILGLENLEARYGNYTLSVNMAGLHKYRSGLEGSGEASLKWFIDKNNHAPVAKAGNDFYVEAGKGYTLDASASYDPDGDGITYHWYAPDGISLDDDQSATPAFTAPSISRDTVLTFVVVVSDGESSANDQVNIFFATATNTELEVTDDNVIVYPNPCTSYFTVYAEGNNVKRIKLLDATGSELKVAKWTGDDKQTVHTGGLPKGVYLVVIETDEKTISRKLLIK